MSEKTDDLERIDSLKRQFSSQYGVPPELIVQAPGRVNLIGEHTDYNDGFVLPIAIDRSVLIASSRRADRMVRLRSLDFEDQVAFSLDDVRYDDRRRWSNYQRGVTLELQKQGFELPGIDALLTSDVPVGSGLSSSAALEVSMAVTWQTLTGFEMSRPELASLCQRAENQFVGVNCGIMDQFISALGQENAALLIDCRSLSYQAVSLPGGVAVVVMDTNKQRGLADSAYNTRRVECEQGVAALQAHLPDIKALRDVSLVEFERYSDELPENVRRRCRHVIAEDERTLQAIDALARGDAATFGKLMNASHASLRDDYEVSCVELDAMVEAAWRAPGVIGARMTGGGFGGCAVALVEQGQAQAFSAQVAQDYQRAVELVPNLYVCSAQEGARAVY